MPVFVQENCTYLLHIHWYKSNILDLTTKSKLAFKFQFMWFSGPLDYVCCTYLSLSNTRLKAPSWVHLPSLSKINAFNFNIQHPINSISLILHFLLIQKYTDSLLHDIIFLTKRSLDNKCDRAGRTHKNISIDSYQHSE